ncbi:MAG: thiolase family protein [Cyanobacteria bacterium P01_H01_bin.74]
MSSANPYFNQTVYILNGLRTPIGSFLGALSSLTAPDLASVVLKQLVASATVSPDAVDEGILGCVLPAGIGQAPARQALKKAGFPDAVGALTINKVCGSGMKAIMLAANTILSGDAHCVIAGGMESMSQSPFYLNRMRTGVKLGHQNLTDGMIHDGLWDPYNDFHMGSCAEACVEKYGFSRQEQDAYAASSYQKAQAAVKNGLFAEEIVPVAVPQRKVDPVIVDTDEEPFKGKIEKLPGLPPAFEKQGTITAGNASTLNDGAAALLLASADFVKAHGLRPIAKIVAHATQSQSPAWFTTAPIGAVESVLKKAGQSVSDSDNFEINEAFSVVAMAAQKELGLPAEKLNVRGGAVALGHPIGASGARIVVTQLHTLLSTQGSVGVSALCIGGGEATALTIETV